MKSKRSFILLTGITVLFFSACKKTTDDFPQGPTESIDTTSYVIWTVTGLQQTGTQLFALVTIENKSGVPVVSNKKLALDNIQGTYKTDKILLPKGEFKLSKFIVVKSSDTAVFATPKVNTAKAAQVSNPLALAFTIEKNGINNAAVQVLKINEADIPENFGYTGADFGFQPSLNLNIQLKITVDQVAYDSLPGKLKIDASNGEGDHWTREIDLQKGVNGIRVPETYSNYKFEIAKWNTVSQKNVSRQELQANMVILLEANRPSKRLLEEASFIENGSGFMADSRTEYFYTANRLNQIKNYQKSLQVSELSLTYVYKFTYTGNNVDSIVRLDATNISTGYTAFSYKTGKIAGISNQSYDQHTGGAVEYIAGGDNEVINIDYLFFNGNTMNYKIFMKGGNMVSDQAHSSTGGSEGGVYEYDNNVNPKYRLGYPDLFFSNYSKNNLTMEQKNYVGSIPSSVPYKFEYVYDDDGYPSEAYISYKGFTSQQHLFRLKKTYKYQ